MTEPITTIARAAAHRLTDQYGPQLPADVEAALHATDDRPQQYLDPFSLGGLIVATATLAWTIYRDLKQKTPTPPPHVISRGVRLQLRDATNLATGERDRVIDIVVTETLNTAHGQPLDSKPADIEDHGSNH